MDTYVIDKFFRNAGGNWRLAMVDPMPSRIFAQLKLAAHEITLDNGTFTGSSPDHFAWTSNDGYSIVWRVRNASRQPVCPPVWANTIAA